MALVTSKGILDKAKKDGYAVGAFNTSTLEATKAIIQAAAERKADIIIATSESEFNFLDPNIIYDQVNDLVKEFGVTAALHLDHGKSFDIVQKAIEAKYTSVHIDGSALPYEENLALTKKVVALAHSKGVSVEGELGHVSGGSEKHDEAISIDEKNLTDPDQAAEFVKETGIDSLAISIGNIHGVYATAPQLDFERLEKIAEIGIPIVLHGGSGIPEDQIRKAISLGVAKVNVNTELRMAYAGALREELAENPDEVVPYKILPEVIEDIEEVVKKKIKLFGL